jgi:DNA helicase-2/ATP-dependent DNA helicase PcrA
VVALERNYRSTQPVLDASNAVIALSAQRYDKHLIRDDDRSPPRPELIAVADDSAQACWIADQVLRHREAGIVLKRQAALFRTAHHSAALELELTRRDIPYVKFGGLKFLEAAHVKDLLSILRWAQNPRSRLAGLRVAQLVPGIGTASAKRLLDEIGTAPDPVEAIRAFRPPPAAAGSWAAFVSTYESLRKDGADWPGAVERARAWYLPQLQRLHEDAAVRAADLAQLARMAQACETRERFLAELTLDPPQATSDEAGAPALDEDYLILSTIHSAKGQEWSAVFVLNVVDGCIPSDMATGDAAAIEEERRLLYVAMTRAQRHLHLLVPQRFYVTQQGQFGDRHVYGTRSRFIPDALLPLFDERLPAAVGPDPDAAPSLASPRAATIDVGARVLSRWM